MFVMYATDENYAELAAVSIESLLDHNKRSDRIIVFIVVDKVAENSVQKLQRTVEKYKQKVIFIPKPDIRNLTGTDLLTLRWSDSAFSRLYLDMVFGEYPEVEKILYLDCDTLILDSLEPLWNIDISDYLGAAVLECMGNMHKRIIGSTSKDHFFNSGVMLLNVKRWKEEHIADKCTAFIKKHNGKIEYVDQGVINGVIARELKIAPVRFNLTALLWDFSYKEMQIYRKPDHGYDEDEWESAKKHPAIIHFTTSFLSIRPWLEGSKTPYTSLWREYHEKSEWKDTPLRIMKDRKLHDMKIRIFNVVPRGLAVQFAGFLHAYVKPVLFVVNGRYNILKNMRIKRR